MLLQPLLLLCEQSVGDLTWKRRHLLCLSVSVSLSVCVCAIITHIIPLVCNLSSDPPSGWNRTRHETAYLTSCAPHLRRRFIPGVSGSFCQQVFDIYERQGTMLQQSIVAWLVYGTPWPEICAFISRKSNSKSARMWLKAVFPTLDAQDNAKLDLPGASCQRESLGREAVD